MLLPDRNIGYVSFPSHNPEASKTKNILLPGWGKLTLIETVITEEMPKFESKPGEALWWDGFYLRLADPLIIAGYDVMG
jgi:hypothetical protein